MSDMYDKILSEIKASVNEEMQELIDFISDTKNLLNSSKLTSKGNEGGLIYYLSEDELYEKKESLLIRSNKLLIKLRE